MTFDHLHHHRTLDTVMVLVAKRSREDEDMTNEVYDTTVARCCSTCVIGMTNGDFTSLSDDELGEWIARRDTMLKALERWEWSGVQCDTWVEDGVRCECDGDEHVMDGSFSRSECEWCGDTDGGDRWNVALMKRLA